MTENINHDSNIMVEKRKDSLIITCPSCGHHIKSQDQGGIIPELPGLPAGVKFDPSDQEILEHLEAKVRSDIHKLHPLIDDFIPTLEGENGICYTHPEKLPGVRKDGMVRHFFHRPSKAYTTGTRKRRKVMTQSDDVEAGSETRWHKTGKTRPVFKNTNMKKVIGHKKILVLYTNYGKQRKPEKTNWVMHQYHLGFNEDEKEGELVVSKVFYQTQPRHCGSTNLNNNNNNNNNHDNLLLHLHHHHHHSKSSSNNGSFVNHYYNGNNSSFLSFDQVVGQHRSSSTNNSQVMSTSSFIP